jgi:hypothetical protein
MRGTPWRTTLVVAVVLSTIGGCAVVFGLDEPSVREGTGGQDATSSSSTSSAAPTTKASSSGGDGDGGAGAGGGGPQGSTGTGATPCDDPAECEDDNPCTQDTCDDGRCDFVALGDGPLEDVPGDCRERSCSGGELVDVADDTEDPEDANAPCELTVCREGLVSPLYAEEGTSCGPSPQVCDGLGACIGCDPSGPDSACGSPTACSAPTCDEPGVCEPNFVPAGPISDPIDGDCSATACTGDSAAPTQVTDDADTPPSSACGMGVCNQGVPSTAMVGEGEPCLVGMGVCDGEGQGANNCVACLETGSQSPVTPAPGCTFATPYCDDETCYECLEDEECASYAADGGRQCLGTGTCGCNDIVDCFNAAKGPICDGNVCGCTQNSNCTSSPRGSRCVGSDACGCLVNSDCLSNSARGNVCLPDDQCGCDDDGDCDAGDTCNLVTRRCF